MSDVVERLADVEWIEEERRSSGKCPSRALSNHDDSLAVMRMDADDAQTTDTTLVETRSAFSCCLIFYRRLSNFVWKGFRSMNSYASSLRVTDQSTGRGRRGGNERATTRTAVPTLLPPLYTSAALTTGAAVGAEATTPAMVGTVRNISPVTP